MYFDLLGKTKQESKSEISWAISNSLDETELDSQWSSEVPSIADLYDKSELESLESEISAITDVGLVQRLMIIGELKLKK